MRGRLRATARFVDVEPVREAGRAGAWLRFRPERSRLVTEPIDDFADLGPELSVPCVGGLGKVLRLLRAARLAPPADPLELVGRPEEAALRLARARGTAVSLWLRPRARLRFRAWTEAGVETVEDVEDVIEHGERILVLRRGGRAPRIFARGEIARHHSESVRWHEVIDIERV